MAKTERPTYKWYVLWILTGVYAFNFIDRQILVILQEPIKAELDLSDTQLGLLTGFVFAIFYVTLGIPIARWADQSNRKNIVALSLATWSTMTAISGSVTNFIQLMLARIGVGVGEAGGSPPAHSMISDYFPPEKRATALSIYSIGLYIGVFLGFLVGGIVGQQYGWRMAFYVLGIPGIFYAVLVYFTVKEPLKGKTDPDHKRTEETPSFLEVMKILMSRKTFVFVALACGLHTFTAYGVGNWFPPFLERVHGMETQSVGIWLAISVGLGGAVGTYTGGFLSDRLRIRDMRWYLWIPGLGALLNFVPMGILYFSPHTQLVLYTTFIFQMLSALFLAPSIAVTHSLLHARMRAMASAVLFFVLNLIGLGLGPLVIGMISDWLSPTMGVEGLRWAFTITFVTGLTTVLFFYQASRFYDKDLERY